MGLSPEIREVVNLNLNNTISIYGEINGNPNGLEEWISQYTGGEIQNNYDFIHGHILGDLHGQSHATARTLLKRALTDEERQDLVDICKSKRNMVSELVDRIKMT